MFRDLVRKIRGSVEDGPDDSKIQRRTVLRAAAGASATGLASSTVGESEASTSPEIADPVARYYTERSEYRPTEAHVATSEEKTLLTEQFMEHEGDLMQMLSKKGIFESTAVGIEAFQTGTAFSEIGVEETNTESAYVGLREVDGLLRSELYYKIQLSADEGAIDQPTEFIISVIPATGDAYAHSTPEIERGIKKEVPQRLIDPDRDVTDIVEEKGTVLGENDVILFGTCWVRCERYTGCYPSCGEIRICCQAGTCSSEYTGYCCSGDCPKACCEGYRDPCPDGSCPQ
ncbi:hypothetical protein [Natronomonas amylolytica]|uniref:hypothetical protein n=1 Tax=Natronomonas amylolytica TaxID=3108498 RepID=UPI00300AD5D4